MQNAKNPWQIFLRKTDTRTEGDGHEFSRKLTVFFFYLVLNKKIASSAAGRSYYDNNQDGAKWSRGAGKYGDVLRED